MKRLVLALAASACAFLPAVTSAATVTNGSFETGTFSGWVVSDLGNGSWLINSSPTGSSLAMAPTDGTRDAYTQQRGPGSHVIYQDIVLEPNHQHTLTLDLGLRNNAGRYATPDSLEHTGGQNQQARVDIVKTTAPVRSVASGDVLLKVFNTPVGSPTVRPMSGVTADLSAFAGQTVRLRIAQVDNLGTFNLTVDKIRITSVSLDTDGDGTPDDADNCPTVANPGQVNTDGDAQGDACDADDDNDGVADGQDAFPLDPTESVDTDGDGIGDNADNCPTVANPGQVNTDGDAQGDACDADDDNDGVADGQDAFPLDPTESVDTDGDGIGNNADTDDDNDGVADGQDAFPLDPTESVDTDGDGIGNNADTDDDGDGVADVEDSSPLDPANARPSTKDQCKNNGFKRFMVNGVTFRNQGDCVSFVATGGKNQPAGR